MKAPTADVIAQVAALLGITPKKARHLVDGKRANVNGGSGEKARGAWCTPQKWADRLGAFDLDAFSNPRSHIVATTHLMLERGDDALAGPGVGTYWASPTGDIIAPGEERRWPSACGRKHASVDTSVFIQPPYELVDEALAHYGHTRFCALLRFDPSTKWFCKLYKLARLVCVPRGERFDFEPPPGVRGGANPHAHAFFYARVEDAPQAVLRACFAWRTRP